MDMKEAMAKRHTVRKYSSGLTDDEASQMSDRIAALNAEFDLAIKLVRSDDSGVNAFAKLFMGSSGATDFFVLAADSSPSAEEKLGYASSDLMLFAQTLGLNSWWIGGTFNRKHIASLVPDKFVSGIVTVGHGASAGVAHKSKSASQVSKYIGTPVPAWFSSGVEAALLAPTALNRQKFFITGSENKVVLTYAPGAMSGSDKGIVKHHFELGAGVSNFEWVDSL